MIESTSPMSRPLRSTTTPASSGFTANTSRSASERRDRYSMPPVSAVGTLPLAARRTDPQARTAAFVARLLTFRARAADQAHAASTPGTTWPGTRDPARLVSEDEAGPPILMPPKPFRRLNNARPTNKAERFLERLPGPHLTGSSPAFSPNARHDGLQPTQHRGGLTPTPAGPTPEGQQASISRTAPLYGVLPTSTSSNVRDTRFTATTSGSASAPGDGTQLLADSAARRSLSRCGRHRSSVRARLHTFHRSASVGIMLPVCRTPPGQ